MIKQTIIKRRKKIKIKVGDKFGRLEVIENLGIIKSKTHFKCKCECGNTKRVDGSNLRRGYTKSCGCLQKEKVTIHGMATTIEYRIWNGMVQRCTNPNNPAYKDYGGRGIEICHEWLNSFGVFLKDMGERPIGLTIERMNNNLGYFKDNCTWATPTKQVRNRRLGKNNKTGIIGVRWLGEYQRYCVQIGVNYKTHHIGYFKNLKDAKAVRIAAEQKYWT